MSSTRPPRGAADDAYEYGALQRAAGRFFALDIILRQTFILPLYGRDSAAQPERYPSMSEKSRQRLVKMGDRPAFTRQVHGDRMLLMLPLNVMMAGRVQGELDQQKMGRVEDRVSLL